MVYRLLENKKGLECSGPLIFMFKNIDVLVLLLQFQFLFPEILIVFHINKIH